MATKHNVDDRIWTMPPPRARYVVSVFDQCGEFDHVPCSDFADLLVTYARMRHRYPGKVVQPCNLDNVDLGWHDGLTDDEREQIDGVA